MTFQPPQMPQDPVELRDRISLSLSLIGHRRHSPELVALIDLALRGASVQDLVDLERAG